MKRTISIIIRMKRKDKKLPMKRTYIYVLILFAVFASTARAGDKAFLRQKTLEILDACCPDGSQIVRMGLKLEKYSSSGDFTTLITGNDERACATSINTIVHEDNHGLHTFMGREVLQEKYGRFSDAFYPYDYFYLGDDRFTLMKKSPTFPSREMAPSIPERLRTFRFPDYIDTGETLQSTQNAGIFGLLDEFNSYTHGTRAAFDLLAYYEQKGAKADWHDFFTGVNSTYYGSLEFRFFILKYLLFAEKAHPDIYNQLMDRKDLLYTLVEVDINQAELMRSYFAAKPLIYKRLRGYGWEVSEDEGSLTIGAGGRRVSHMNFLNVYNLLDAEMKKPEYQALMRTIEEKAAEYDPESVYAEIEADMKGLKFEDTEGGARKEGTVRPEDRLALESGAGRSGLRVEFDDPEGDAVAASGSSDVRFPFIDLVHASMAKTEDGLTVRMRFADFPEKLPFNETGVDDNQMEYQWRALFDLDGNGTDDFSIDVIHFKKSGDRPVRGEIFGYAQASLWKVETNGASMEDVSVAGEKQGNEIVLEIPPCAFVSKIKKETRIRFSTYHTNGNKWAEDFLPD
jgi:hypothetical protein